MAQADIPAGSRGPVVETAQPDASGTPAAFRRATEKVYLRVMSDQAQITRPTMARRKSDW